MKQYTIVAMLLALLSVAAGPVSASHDSCAIDIADLDIDGDVIEARVRNTGSQATTVEVKFFADDDFLERKSRSLSSGETETFEVRHDFDEGATEVEVEARAGCGDREEESITHVVLDGEDRDEDRGFEEERDFNEETCGIDIKGMDFTTRSFLGEPVTVAVETVNTGNTKQDAEIILHLDGSAKETFSKELFPGQAERHVFRMFPTEGGHRMSITARNGCGVVDTLTRSFEVIPLKMDIISLQEPETNVPAETTVAFHPTHLDIETGQGEAVKLSIISSKPQNFLISQEGLQQDWISFEPKVFVSGEKDVFALVTPKNLGQKEFVLSVKAETEGVTFSKRIAVFGSLPPEENGAGQDYLAFIRSAWGMAAAVLIAAIVLIIVAIAFIRRYNIHTVVSDQPEEPGKGKTAGRFSEKFERIKRQIHGEGIARPEKTPQKAVRSGRSDALRRIKEQINR